MARTHDDFQMTEKNRRAAALLHHRAKTLKRGDPVAPPIVQSSVFHLPGEPEAAYQYGRFGHPNWDMVEAQLAIIEDAPCVIFPSGMAAIAAVLYATLKSGDEIVLPDDGYFTTKAFAQEFLAPLGVTTHLHPTTDYVRASFEGTALVLLETPSNPGLDVCDIAAVATKTKAAGARFIVDNTMMTPFGQRPLDLGADIVVAAATKAPGGHSDALLGYVASRDENLITTIRDWRRLAGAIPGAMDAWLVHRGLETLDVRLERMCATAGIIAARLQEHAGVQSVRYPGLKTDPSYEVAKKQMDNFGFIIGLTLKNKSVAERFLSACPLIAQTTSFGSVHSSAERRARWGDAVPEGFVRLSVGCEPVDVLWAAIDEALTSVVVNG